MANVEVRMSTKERFEGYSLVEGFPGIGLVGTISASYLAEKLKMELIGYILSNKFPPMASIHNGMPIYPARFYLDRKNKLIVVYSDFVIPTAIVYETANAIFDMAKANRMKEIISLAGMTSTFVPEKRYIYSMVSMPEVRERVKKLGVKFIQEGVTTGVSGILLAKCALEKFPAFSLLVESSPAYPDPGAAAFLLKSLGDYMGVKIETKALEEEAKHIQERIQKTIEQIRLGKEKYKRAEEHLPMYG